MTRHAILYLILAASFLPLAVQAGEADDLQRQIEYLKQTSNDLERQDEQKEVNGDVMIMRSWLDTAWNLRSLEKYDDVRGILDRCEAQANMIRQRITAAKLAAQAEVKESELKRARVRLDSTKKAVENAKIQKARLEGKV
jgi:predicted ribosome quality control (RQC) complex YloA/Tae2 family protein